MTSITADRDLVSAYAAEGSEAAFRALVARHVDLVYATAVRQMGDAGAAEEVTQNVFMALARKAPRLGGVETLAGWLHCTAVLEAKARIRAELRRRRREEAAMELAALDREGASPLAAMVPLVDEGLLTLRDGDRLALLLRYWEQRSLRDVGAALGVDEDAARKRVSRALDRLGEFFRRRGLAVSAVGGSAGLLAGTAKSAPAGLALSSTQAGLAIGGAATGLPLLWMQLMSLTKTQTVIVCALLASAPLAWQWRVEANVRREQSALAAGVRESEQKADDLEASLQRTRASIERLRADRMTNETRLAALNARLGDPAKPAVYRWDDNSPVVRVPKKFLSQLPIGSVQGAHGKLTEQIKAALQLTDTEAQDAQAEVDRFLAKFQSEQAVRMKRVEPGDKDLEGHRPSEVRVFEAFTKTGALLPEVAQVLAASPEQQQVLNRELPRLLAAYRDLEVAKAVRSDEALPGINNGQIVTIQIPPLPEEGARLEQEFADTLRNQLGSQRSEMLLQSADSWMEEQFGQRNGGGESKIFSVVRHPDGTYNISIKHGNNWFSTGGPRSLEYNLPAHLLPLFSEIAPPREQ